MTLPSYPLPRESVNYSGLPSVHTTTKPDVVSSSSQDPMASGLVSRNVTIDGTRRTSVRLEPEMWNGLRDICRREHMSLHDVCTAVWARKGAGASLTAAIRVFIMAYYRAAATEDGHNNAGHGPGGTFMMSFQSTVVRPRPLRAVPLSSAAPLRAVGDNKTSDEKSGQR